MTLLVWGLILGWQSEPPSLATYMDSFQQLQGESVSVNNVTWAWGNATFTFVSGSLAEVEAPDGTKGIFFEGRGAFIYHSVDPSEAAVTQFNTQKLTNFAVEKGEQDVQLSTDFQRIFLRGTGSGFQLPSGPPGADLRKAFTQHQQDYVQNRGPAGIHRLTHHTLNGDKQPFVIAQIDADRRHLVYTFDPTTRQRESVYVLQKNEDRNGPRANYLNPAFLSDQPIGGARAKFVHAPYLLTHIDYQLTANDRNLDLKITETVRPSRPMRALLFSLISEVADRYDLFPYTLQSVKDEAGNALDFHHHNNSLIVILPKTAPANTPLKLSFHIQGDILVRPFGNNYWKLHTFPWFPRPDLNGRFYTVSGTSRINAPFEIFASGDAVNRSQEGDTNILETRVDKPIQFFTVHGGKYLYEETEKDGLSITVASYGLEKSRAFRNLDLMTRELINFYQSFLGPFPFKNFQIVELDGQGFGQAPPGMMFITSEAFSPLDRDNRRMSRTVYQRLAHEVAHQYWGHAVKMGSYEEQWFTESFAEYCAALAVRAFQSEGRYKNMIRAWRGHAKQATKVSSIPTAYLIFGKDPLKNRLWRQYLVYDKGAYLLHKIHKDLGDERFAQFLKLYQDTFAWKFASTHEAIRVLDAISEEDYPNWFQQYFWSTQLPK